LIIIYNKYSWHFIFYITTMLNIHRYAENLLLKQHKNRKS